MKNVSRTMQIVTVILVCIVAVLGYQVVRLSQRIAHLQLHIEAVKDNQFDLSIFVTDLETQMKARELNEIDLIKAITALEQTIDKKKPTDE